MDLDYTAEKSTKCHALDSLYRYSLEDSFYTFLFVNILRIMTTEHVYERTLLELHVIERQLQSNQMRDFDLSQFKVQQSASGTAGFRCSKFRHLYSPPAPTYFLRICSLKEQHKVQQELSNHILLV